MKKLHKLILKAFLGPFLITFAVVVFILLTQFMMSYIDDFKGKGLEISVFAELFFYFSFSTMPRALPLAILLSCLMTYGNLGQHNELTAIKSSGVSLLRILFPIFLFVSMLSVGTFYFNDYVLPKANLKGYRLLYDIRHKKPTLDVQEGMFYNGIPGYSLRVDKKHDDGKSLNGVIIYDHTENRGNIAVIVADSGYMYTMKQGAYLVVELFNGIRSSEYLNKKTIGDEYIRTKFSKTKMVFDLSSFQLNNTPEQLFSTNKRMLTTAQLQTAKDSAAVLIGKIQEECEQRISAKFKYDIITQSSFVKTTEILPSYEISEQDKKIILDKALNKSRSIRGYTDSMVSRSKNTFRDLYSFDYERVRKYAGAFACIVMFLLGAPMGSILKKGGLGIPTLISILMFIIYYVISMTGYKNAKEGLLDVYVGGWLPDIILLPFGFFFLYQAYRDSRLFEFDAINQLIQKIKPKKSND